MMTLLSLLKHTLRVIQVPELSPTVWHKALRRTEPLHLYQTEPSLPAKCDTAHNTTSPMGGSMALNTTILPANGACKPDTLLRSVCRSINVSSAMGLDISNNTATTPTRDAMTAASATYPMTTLTLLTHCVP